MPPAASRRKRLFQPSSQKTLDAFISRQSSSQSPPSLFPSASAPEPSTRAFSEGFPTQPPSIQASLLHVGLRVRKSVPEGYKTHKTLGLDTSDYENMDQSNSDAGRAPPASAPELLDGRRELEPFCGIHRVGGYGVQTSSQPSVPSLLFSSQESQASTNRGWDADRRERNDRKREREEDYDDELLDQALGLEEDEQESDEEPISLASKHERPTVSMSRARSPLGAGLRSRQQFARKSRGTMGLGGGGVVVVDDFPEAEFLRPVEDMDVED